MTRPLQVSPCLDRCAWRGTGDVLDGEPLFSCLGCGSEWVPSQPWTPVNASGVVPRAVQALRRTRGRG